MKKFLVVLPLSLSLAGCPLMEMVAPSSAAAPANASAASAAPTPITLGTFLNKLEGARGTALSVAEKASVVAAVGQTKNLIDGTQNKFMNSVSQFTGLDAATLGALIPQASQSLSQNDVLNKVESKLGRKLGGAEEIAAKAATTLRNNSLDSLKSGLASKVGKLIGVDGEVVQSLLPLAGL